MIENNVEKKQRAVLVAVDTGEYDARVSLDELEELAVTAGAETAAKVLQKRSGFDPATVIGSGRLSEIAEFCRGDGADLVVFDCELSPAQMRNIEDACGVPVIDRTTLILDIFAQRAVTAEGKLQVELAQLRYRLPRLTGLGGALSRLGGGIGTRGPAKASSKPTAGTSGGGSPRCRTSSPSWKSGGDSCAPAAKRRGSRPLRSSATPTSANRPS